MHRDTEKLCPTWLLGGEKSHNYSYPLFQAKAYINAEYKFRFRGRSPCNSNLPRPSQPQFPNGGFPKLGVFFGGSVEEGLQVYWGLYWGPLVSGNYPVVLQSKLLKRGVIGDSTGLYRVQGLNPKP